jgi:WhiB family redox-sensing transcriptional regulator
MTTTTSVPEWRNAANCLREDPELFFTGGPGEATDARVERAQQVCRHCPVAAACLQYALDAGADFGVWGGFTPKERRRLLRRRRLVRQSQEGDLAR